jgi:hypothetical protein
LEANCFGANNVNRILSLVVSSRSEFGGAEEDSHSVEHSQQRRGTPTGEPARVFDNKHVVIGGMDLRVDTGKFLALLGFLR